MLIMGLQKLTLLDFPGKMACTVFTGGCNFRCPFCHNAPLVTPGDYKPEVSEEEFFEFLKKRKGILDGVAITGGEPTLQPDLEAFMQKVKQMGFLVKLDTNGFKPTRLKGLVKDGLVDYVAMDIKNSKEKYALTAGIENLKLSNIEESIDFLMHGNVDFEFRTTLIKEYHTAFDMEQIGKWLKGNEKYFLQSFEDSGAVIKGGLSGLDDAETKQFLDIVKKYIPNAQIRGK